MSASQPHQAILKQFEKVLANVEKECDQLSAFPSKDMVSTTVQGARELVNVGEEGVGFENLVDNLYECDFPLSVDLYREIETLGNLLALDRSAWNSLETLVDSAS